MGVARGIIPFLLFFVLDDPIAKMLYFPDRKMAPGSLVV
jgi:hypothetical protein